MRIANSVSSQPSRTRRAKNRQKPSCETHRSQNAATNSRFSLIKQRKSSVTPHSKIVEIFFAQAAANRAQKDFFSRISQESKNPTNLLSMS
jgi:hypothetical protein